MTRPGPIVVYGANGYTGGMIVEELVRRGLSVKVAGRKAAELEALAQRSAPALPWQAVKVEDAEGLQRLLSGCSVLVNAAGPYSVTGRPMLEAALGAGCHYVDVCADPLVIRDFFETLDGAAQRAGCSALPGMSFYFALSDFLAAVVAEGRGELTSLKIGYALDAWGFTPGSQAAFWDMVGRRLTFEERVLRETDAPGKVWTFPFLPPLGDARVFEYPGGDVVTVPRHVDTPSVTVGMTVATFVPRWLRSLMPVGLLLLGLISRSWLGPRLRRWALARAPRDLEAERAKTGFTVEVHGHAGTEVSKAAVRGRHMYALGAWITADAAARLAAGEVGRTGVLAPAQAFEAKSYLRALAAHPLVREVQV